MLKRSRNAEPWRGGPSQTGRRRRFHDIEKRGDVAYDKCLPSPRPLCLPLLEPPSLQAEIIPFFIIKASVEVSGLLVGNASSRSPSPVHPVVTASGVIAGARVTQPACGYRVAVGGTGGENVASFNR